MTATELIDVEGLRTDVEAVLADHLGELSAELDGVGADNRLVEAMRATVAGGKRLRAAFCYWSWRAHGGDGAEGAERDDVLRVGAALELFQAAALVHDDVMDDSDTRRGRAAAHRSFADLHLEQGWTGPAEPFGNSVAILLGDLALIASERVFDSARLGPRVRLAAREVFDRMRTEVIAGQYLDVLAQALPLEHGAATDEGRARAVIRYKSARYSVEHPLALGAALADADDDAVAACRAIGLPLGEAFQLRDDMLGVFGDPATTGKPAGDDLRQGKRTVLVSRALSLANRADRTRLSRAIGRRDLTDDDVARLRSLLHRTGAVDQVEQLIDSLAGPALRALSEAALAEPGRSMLVRLGRAAVDRHA